MEIDCPCRPESEYIGGILVTSTRYHVDTGVARELDSISANLARAAMHEHRMTASELRMVEQHLLAVTATTGTEAASIADKTLGFIASMSATAAAYSA